MLSKGAIEPVENPAAGFYSQSFVVKKKMGSLFPVIELKALNQHLSAPHFKIEVAQSIRGHLCQADNDSTVHERHIFSYSSSPSVLKVHMIHIMGSSVSIQQNVPQYLPSTIHIHDGAPSFSGISLKKMNFDSPLFAWT